MEHVTILEVEIRDVRFGNNVKIIKPVNIYECTIGDNCFIGPFVEIQKVDYIPTFAGKYRFAVSELNT